MRIFLSFFLLASAWHIALAESPSEILSFGKSLYQEKDYYRAITEYKRFCHLYPLSPKTHEVQFQIGFSYLLGQKWEAAIPYFQSLTDDPKLKEDAQFAIAQVQFLSKQYPYAIDEWKHFLDKYPKSQFLDAAHYQIAWAYFLQQENEKAKVELNQIILSTNPRVGKREGSPVALSQQIDKWDQLPYRSPFLAGLMSATLPGSGQWYDGRFWDGASALLVNGMFAYGLYATWTQKYYASFGILAFIASGFYGGNIFSAVSSAHKFNRNVKESTWANLEKKYGLHLDWTGSRLTIQF